MTLEYNSPLLPLCILRPDVPFWTLVPTHSPYFRHTRLLLDSQLFPEGGAVSVPAPSMCNALSSNPTSTPNQSFSKTWPREPLRTACHFLSLLTPVARLPHPWHLRCSPSQTSCLQRCWASEHLALTCLHSTCRLSLFNFHAHLRVTAWMHTLHMPAHTHRTCTNAKQFVFPHPSYFCISVNIF